jgi:hypothetical protein
MEVLESAPVSVHDHPDDYSPTLRNWYPLLINLGVLPGAFPSLSCIRALRRIERQIDVLVPIGKEKFNSPHGMSKPSLVSDT